MYLDIKGFDYYRLSLNLYVLIYDMDDYYLKPEWGDYIIKKFAAHRRGFDGYYFTSEIAAKKAVEWLNSQLVADELTKE